MSSVQITREALYDQVWSEPMCHVSKRYGISDVGLAKICRKHKIPCPPRGYWAKKTAGQALEQIPLPKSNDSVKIVIREASNSLAAPLLSPDLQQRVAEEIGRPLVIELRDHLRSAHPLVSAANQQTQTIRVGADGLVVIPDGFPLELHVSKDSFRRSLFIVDALLRAFEGRGDVVGRGPHVILLDIPVYFSLSESFVTHKEEVHPTDFRGEYEFNFNRYHTTKIPSGKLTLHIRDHTHHPFLRCRQNWRDSPNQPLEQRLEAIVTGLLEFAAAAKNAEQERLRVEEERQRAELRRQEEARQRAARRATFQEEKRRFDELMETSVRWRKSQVLREYIAAAKLAYLDRHGEIRPDSDMARWFEWAIRQADWLDPLIDSPPSLLDEKWEDEQKYAPGQFRRW